ncbi:MAG: hypothetical protein ACKVP2_10635 [Burkholderiales bacterium]
MTREYVTATHWTGALHAVLFCTAVASGHAFAAESSLSVGAEYFDWKEATSPEVSETGPLVAATFHVMQDKDAGLVLGYRGKIWGGRVTYEGSTLFGNTPVSGKTGYMGISNEFQLRWRRAGDQSRVDAVLGLGMDIWRRSLSSVQKEDYYIVFGRLGMASAATDVRKWSAGLGVKYPLWTRENAYLTDIGFDSNPLLEPGGQVSPYADVGYRLADDTQLVLYYDSFRFSRSPEVQTSAVSSGFSNVSIYQPASTFSVIGIRIEQRIR